MSSNWSQKKLSEENNIEKVIRHRTTKSSKSPTMPMNYSRPGYSRFYRNLSQKILFILILLTLVFIFYSSISLSPLLRLLDPYSYVIVLDAGSTGTRIHVYKFQSSLDNENLDTFVLKNEIFEEKKPGLSSFADHIDHAEQQIDDLLNIADKHVSRFKHRTSPIVLRATAGLRLLNENKQKLLLESVSKSFSKYGFYRPKLDIAIMNETEEGIDAWLTLVYLKGEQFYGSRIAALDLGGGSTQITYNPSLSNTDLGKKLNLLLKAQQPMQPGEINAFHDSINKKRKQMPRIDVDQAGLQEIEPVQSLKNNPDHNNENNEQISEEQSVINYMHQFRMFGRDIHLYSRSYLGYGLMIARQQIFQNETNDPQLIESHQLRTNCFVPQVQGTFKFQETKWHVQSLSNSEFNGEDRFYTCLSIIDPYISRHVQSAIGLDQMSIYVFSYFYDIANDAGLLSNQIDPSSSSSTITTLLIRDLKQTAKNICRGSTKSNEYPFLCFDLTYIYSLLTKGYRLSEDIQINICKKIQQFEVAWSLGLALKLL